MYNYASHLLGRLTRSEARESMMVICSGELDDPIAIDLILKTYGSYRTRAIKDAAKSKVNDLEDHLEVFGVCLHWNDE